MSVLLFLQNCRIHLKVILIVLISLIYNALIQHHFDYDSCGKTLSDRLQKLQNRAARVLTSSSYDADANSKIHQLRWKDLCTQRQIQKALIGHKSLNGPAPKYLSSKFVKREDSVNKLDVLVPRTNYLRNSL